LIVWLVDVEFVAFRVFHPDRVVVEPFSGHCAADGGAQGGQPGGLGVDAVAAGLEGVGALAAGVDVEVQPVLDRLGVRLDAEPDVRAMAVRVADPVRAVDQVLVGQPEIAVEIVPGSETSRGRRGFITLRGGLEPGQPVRVGAATASLDGTIRLRNPATRPRPNTRALASRQDHTRRGAHPRSVQGGLSTSACGTHGSARPIGVFGEDEAACA
jgi:hypothetical protein